MQGQNAKIIVEISSEQQKIAKKTAKKITWKNEEKSNEEEQQTKRRNEQTELARKEKVWKNLIRKRKTINIKHKAR